MILAENLIEGHIFYFILRGSPYFYISNFKMRVFAAVGCKPEGELSVASSWRSSRAAQGAVRLVAIHDGSGAEILLLSSETWFGCYSQM